MTGTEPLTPDAVRALIAEAENQANLGEVYGQTLMPGMIRRLTAALETSLPSEDADLDAIEARENACPGCDGSGSCLAPAHQHGCFADVLGHCNAPEDHPTFARTVETAEECGALAEGTVIRDSHQEVYVRDGGGLEQNGVAGKWGLNWAVYPAVVIAEPVSPSPKGQS